MLCHEVCCLQYPKAVKIHGKGRVATQDSWGQQRLGWPFDTFWFPAPTAVGTGARPMPFQNRRVKRAVANIQH